MVEEQGMTAVRFRFWIILLAPMSVGPWLSSPLAAQSLPTVRPEEVGVSSKKVEGLSKFMQSLVDDGKISGGVTVMARHGKLIHLKAVGMADREAKTPMQTDSIFRIASMTKPITSVAIMMLWEQSKLDLDDPVSKYIPEFESPKVLVGVNPLKTRPAIVEITIRHLLTHTAGLGYSCTDQIGPIYERSGILAGLVRSEVPLEQYMKNLADMPLLFEPGERWEYSLATDVLGRVVEVVSGVAFDDFIESEISRPLGMDDTFFRVPLAKRSRLVAAYVPVGTCIRKVKTGEILKERFGGGMVTLSSDYPYAETQRYLSGGGGLCSTASDFLQFCQMLLNGGHLNDTRLLAESTVKAMTHNQIGEMQIPGLSNLFGYGFTIFPDERDIHDQLRDAYAWFGYWTTSFRISPRGDWIIITLSQLAWDETSTPKWFSEYERIAGEAIEH
jgi:CubicO group peptidase (beta-lactamase class C family)